MTPNLIGSGSGTGIFNLTIKKMRNCGLSAIKMMEQEAARIKGSVSLAQGIPSFGSHPLIRERVIGAINEGLVDKYSPVAGLHELRDLVARELGGEYSPETEIVVVGGAVEALSATITALFKRGDELIVLTPSYPYYSRICETVGVGFVPVELGENWSLPMDRLKAAITSRTKGIVICNPNNPTGTILTKEELLSIGDLAVENDLIVISDDVYEELTYDGEPVFNLRHDKRLRERLIRIVSLSKSFALSGWRIGFLHGPEGLVKSILRIHDNMMNCAPVVSQYAAVGAIENRNEIIPGYVLEYRKRREIMERHLRLMGDTIDFTRPSGAYFFFPRIRGVNDSERFCLEMLHETGLAAVPGSEFGPGGEGHVRLCFGRSEEDIEEGMSRMGKYLVKSKDRL